MNTALLLLPDFALILLGVAIRRWMHLGDHFWNGVEKLVYFILFPALLINAIIKTRLDLASAMPLLGAAFAAMVGGIIGKSGDKDMDRIDRVTASAQSRLGAPVSEVFGDETGLFTVSNKLVAVWQTMRRGAAGMGGRSTETTNAFDPAENSAAQMTQESLRPDIFRYWRDPDVLKHADGTTLKWSVARDRRKVLAYVYAGAAHINLDSAGRQPPRSPPRS